MPELGHNEIVGFAPGTDALSHVVIVTLRAAAEHARIAVRLEAAARIARDVVGGVEAARVHGKSALAQLASAVHLGDLVSVYLAILRGVDPTPIDAIVRLKSEVT
jgi:glucose/mannose-6-phosphate isomerase